MPQRDILTKQDLLFIDEYFINGFNATQAYKKVFKNSLKPNAQKQCAYKLMSKNIIKKEIELRFEEIQKANIITRTELLSNLKDLMLESILLKDNVILLKTVDTINKMMGNYTTIIDATLNGNINIIIPGLELPEETEETED
jgi:hypothetical protein